MSAEHERDYWDSVANDDPVTMIRDGDWSTETPADLAMLLPPLDDRGPVLDLGCGIGRLTVEYACAYRVPVVGVDVSPEMIRRASRHAVARTSYLLGDGRSLPLVFELAGAFSMLMFQHIPADAQATYVKQVAERLRPGAAFTFQTVHGTEDTFLSHQVASCEPSEWCEAGGLKVESASAGTRRGWQWTTGRKPVR